MGLADRDYTKTHSKSTIDYKQKMDVDEFIQKSYAQAVRERDAGLFTKIKNKILRILRL